PQENRLSFEYDNSFYKQHESDLGFEAFRLKRVLNKYLPDNPFTFHYKTEYSFDFRKLDKGFDELELKEDVFWNRLFSEIHGNDLQISQTHRTISFDFETEEELNHKIDFIKSFQFFDIYDRGEKHKFK